MNKEELKIGNIITYDGVIATVKCLHYNYLTVAFNVGGKEVLSDVNYDKCAGLPLSPAILEKAGFEKEHEYKWKLQVNNDCSLVCNTYWNIQTYSDLIELNIKYLHQLQNLYFALTGQELTLNTK